jgi:hypothetical protein
MIIFQAEIIEEIQKESRCATGDARLRKKPQPKISNDSRANSGERII